MAAAAGARIGKKHIIVSAIEHHAVLNPAKSLERQGFRLAHLPVTPEGLVLPEALEAAICPDTALVSVMYANNEVGTIQPVEESCGDLQDARRVVSYGCSAGSRACGNRPDKAAGGFPVCLGT